MSYRILHDRSNLNQRSGWNDQHGGLFRILMPKDQGNDQTKNTDGRHHAENCWDAKLTFQDRQNKDAESRTDFSDTSSETAGCGPQLRGDRKSTRLNSSHQIISYAVF